MPANDQNKILILFAHPALEKSRVNSRLTAAVRGAEGVTFHDLYQEYPDLQIDVRREQELLEAHDFIIFHHPFFWYSTPAILKEWQDLVLEHGWAYGSQGNALKDKIFMNVITTGGKEIAYHTEGKNRFTLRQLLAPIEQTANLCKMIFIAPFVVHGTHSITPEEVDACGREYAEILRALREGRVDIPLARTLGRLNDPSARVILQLETK
jgi:glutathione-regulated potassium-efflux system ancillary protein KefG